MKHVIAFDVSMVVYDHNQHYQYEGELEHNQGKLHKVAIIASMNKFLKVVFHLIQNGLLYQFSFKIKAY